MDRDHRRPRRSHGTTPDRLADQCRAAQRTKARKSRPEAALATRHGGGVSRRRHGMAFDDTQPRGARRGLARLGENIGAAREGNGRPRWRDNHTVDEAQAELTGLGSSSMGS